LSEAEKFSGPIGRAQVEEERLKDRARRRRELVLIGIFLVAIVFAFYLELHLSRIAEEQATFPLTSSLVFFAFWNLIVILVLVVLFLVVRNVVKLVFERRRGVLGAHLRTRLVAAFVGLTLGPAVVLFALSAFFINVSVERWFDPEVKNLYETSSQIISNTYNATGEETLHYAQELSRAITVGKLLSSENAESLKSYVEEKQVEYNLGMVEIFSTQRETILRVNLPEVPGDSFTRPDAEAIQKALSGQEGFFHEAVGAKEVIRGVYPVFSSWEEKRRDIVGVVVVNKYVSKSLLRQLRENKRAFDDYQQLLSRQLHIKSQHFTILILITLAILFLAVWFGFYLAKGVTVPIQLLAEGTREVAGGNLDYRIDIEAEDEIGTLVQSFNTMTQDLSRSRDELVRAQRALAWREVARRIAHEIKNPLTPIQLSAQRLQRRYREKLSGEDRKVFQECTETIIKQVEDLKSLVNEFSLFARLPTINPAPNDLNQIAREAVALFREAHRHLDFELNEDKRLPVFDVDPDQMKRAFINLLDNAVESIEGPGRVKVEIIYEEELQMARVEISDTGRGIQMDDIERVFEPYYSTKSHGTGLGLTIVQRIITDHYGHIRVTANEPKGTRFILELPVGMSYPARSEGSAGEVGGVSEGSGGQI
jgi:nitrogen fixation/metabolism regulation signal transduction histidine kinase